MPKQLVNFHLEVLLYQGSSVGVRFKLYYSDNSSVVYDSDLAILPADFVTFLRTTNFITQSLHEKDGLLVTIEEMDGLIHPVDISEDKVVIDKVISLAKQWSNR
jgi:hypothetical protein